MKIKTEKIKEGIIKITRNDNEYIFWTHADIVRPFVKKFLKQRLPEDIVIDEINNIDIVVVGENLPVEIQSTSANSNGVQVANFEKDIESQIRQNIENHGVCWLFFDSEFLRYIQDPDLHRKVSINMDWFRKYMKEERLKVFTIRYDGTITEKDYKDFDFLSNISMVCKIGYDNDERVLNRNKLHILGRVLRGYRFSQGEIDQFQSDWEKSDSKGDLQNFLYKHKNERARLYARILHTIGGYLDAINDILDLNIEDVDMKHEKYYTSVLGLFDFENRGGSASTAIFVDKFNVREYFPGYLRNKDTWDHLKGRLIQSRKLDKILKREYTVTKGVDYFWGKDVGI